MPAHIVENAVYTSKETAEQMRISERHLRKLVGNGRIKPLAYCTGKHLFTGSEILRCLTEAEAAA